MGENSLESRAAGLHGGHLKGHVASAACCRVVSSNRVYTASHSSVGFRYQLLYTTEQFEKVKTRRRVNALFFVLTTMRRYAEDTKPFQYFLRRVPTVTCTPGDTHKVLVSRARCLQSGVVYTSSDSPGGV